MSPRMDCPDSLTGSHRLIKSSRVIDGHITYSNKDITNVFLVFQERWSLHKRGEPTQPGEAVV
jgi:hypothetical protein